MPTIKTLSPELRAALADSLDLDISAVAPEPEFRPYMIATEYRASVFDGVPESVKEYARTLRDQHGWKFYPVSQSRGRCYYRPKVITIPVHAIVRAIDYKTWYISHEMAHAYDASRSNHGDPFMRKLIEICPPEFVHHELGYKPRNAARNGIAKPDDTWLI
jgi:hypothetical protein